MVATLELTLDELKDFAELELPPLEEIDELEDFKELELALDGMLDVLLATLLEMLLLDRLLLVTLLDFMLERLVSIVLEATLERNIPEEILVGLLDKLPSEDELKSTCLLEFVL